MSNRSCGECNRKKSKCDRKKPRCSRCQQSNKICSYPAYRKRPSFEIQYSKFRQKLLQEVEAGNSGVLDRLLDQVDFDALQDAVRRRDSRSDNATPSADSSFPETLETGNSWDMEPFSMDPEVAPSNGSTSVDIISHGRGGFQVAGISIDEMSYESPTANMWNFQEGYLAEFDISTGYDSTNSPWQPQIPSNTILAETPSSTSENPTPLAFLDSNLECSSTISLSVAIVDELITLFFEKVASFIPLFNATSFQQKYRLHPDDAPCREFDMEEKLILYSMFALSARFSASPLFAGTAPKARGVVFATMAQSIYDNTARLDSIEQCTLSYLQGCILLAFYHQTSRPSTRSWMLIGTCCRVAIELGLDRLDEDIILSPHEPQWTSSMEWSRKEERRRAWWLVWELDVFASTILRRPHMIDKSQMQVLLPVSDKNWFANNPIASAAFPSDPLNAWETLNDSPNQDERAWFLVSSYLMATAHDISQRHDTCSQDQANFEATLDCFSLLLPSSFHLSSGSLTFNEENFSSSNWIISTIFMLHTARAILGHNRAKASNPEDLKWSPRDITTNAQSSDTQLVFRAIQAWMPQFIASACPFVACTILGPALCNVRAACVLQTQPGQAANKATTVRYGLQLEMLKLVLKRIGNFWDIGTSTLRLVQILEREWGPAPVDNDVRVEYENLAKSFSLLVPVAPLNKMLDSRSV